MTKRIDLNHTIASPSHFFARSGVTPDGSSKPLSSEGLVLLVIKRSATTWSCHLRIIGQRTTSIKSTYIANRLHRQVGPIVSSSMVDITTVICTIAAVLFDLHLEVELLRALSSLAPTSAYPFSSTRESFKRSRLTWLVSHPHPHPHPHVVESITTHVACDTSPVGSTSRLYLPFQNP